MISRNTWSYGGTPACAFGADEDVARATATANPAAAIWCLETRYVQLFITGSLRRPNESGFATSTLPTWRNAWVIAISQMRKLEVSRGVRNGLHVTAAAGFVRRDMFFIVESRRRM